LITLQKFAFTSYKEGKLFVNPNHTMTTIYSFALSVTKDLAERRDKTYNTLQYTKCRARVSVDGIKTDMAKV